VIPESVYSSQSPYLRSWLSGRNCPRLPHLVQIGGITGFELLDPDRAICTAFFQGGFPKKLRTETTNLMSQTRKNPSQCLTEIVWPAIVSLLGPADGNLKADACLRKIQQYTGERTSGELQVCHPSEHVVAYRRRTWSDCSYSVSTPNNPERAVRQRFIKLPRYTRCLYDFLISR
jgi:hypothetical protein